MITGTEASAILHAGRGVVFGERFLPHVQAPDVKGAVA
jgi:hypothetical protein